MRFKRMIEREQMKKQKAREKALHPGMKMNRGKWVIAPQPIRKYFNRKIERHSKVL